jgi:hypothetical protein
VIDLFDSYSETNGQHLSTAYSINAEIRHFWTPTIRSSLACYSRGAAMFRTCLACTALANSYTAQFVLTRPETRRTKLMRKRGES